MKSKIEKFVYTTIILVFFVFSSIWAGEDFYQAVKAGAKDHFSQTDHKCGFPLVMQAQQPGNEKMLAKLQDWRTSSLELDSVYFSPSGHFKIHYTVSGGNAIPRYDRNQNGTSDYLEFVAKSFDRAWEIEIDSLGFNPPPDSSGNPRQVYPIYCKRISIYGSTLLLYELAEKEGINYVTEIEINTDFSFVNYEDVDDDIVRDSLAIAVTSAHEFNHSLQSGYRLWENETGSSFADIWFIESSAVFMEEVLCPQVNDYLQYLPSYFRDADQSMNNSDGSWRDYGKVVFEILLGQRWGKNITRRIWEEITNQRAMPAIEAVMQRLGSSVLEETGNLAGWLYFSGTRAVSGAYFPDAGLFPPLTFTNTEPVTNENAEVLVDSLPPYAMRFYKTDLQSLVPRTYLLKYLNQSSSLGLETVFMNDPVDFFVTPVSASFSLPDDMADSLVFSVVSGENPDTPTSLFHLLSRPQGGAFGSGIYVYPQPLNLSQIQPALTFANLPENSRVMIFTANGKQLKTIESPEGLVVWDLKVNSEHTLATGVYLYRVIWDGGTKEGKFVILR